MKTFNFNTTAKKGMAGTGLFLALALPVTAHHEGLRLKAYLDPVNIPTICYGETENVSLGDVKTKEECDDMLAVRLAWFGAQVQKEVPYTLPPETHAAIASFAYNVGIGAYKRSTLLKKLKEGDIVGACNELPKWKYAGGMVLNGLIKRREAEKELCLRGANAA